MGEGERSLEGFSLPERVQGKNALAAVWATRNRMEEEGNPCDVPGLCGAVDFSAVRRVFLQNWKG